MHSHELLITKLSKFATSGSKASVPKVTVICCICCICTVIIWFGHLTRRRSPFKTHPMIASGVIFCCEVSERFPRAADSVRVCSRTARRRPLASHCGGQRDDKRGAIKMIYLIWTCRGFSHRLSRFVGHSCKLSEGANFGSCELWESALRLFCR